jgi:hypothetical protein
MGKKQRSRFERSSFVRARSLMDESIVSVPSTGNRSYNVCGGPGGIRTLDLRRVRAAYGFRSVHTRLDYRPVPPSKAVLIFLV